MKKWISAVCVLMTVLVMVGCGSSFDPSATSLYIQDNGVITQAIVETFEKDYYSVAEFESMIEKEVAAYNGRYGKDAISVTRLEVEEDTLYLLMDYTDAEVFSQYNEVYFYMGTVEEALDEGLSFNMVFKDAEYEEHTAADATSKKSSHVAVVRDEGIIQLEKPVKYVSNNVEIISEHMLQVMPIEDKEEYAYIIY
ncbi:MAG: hypothetical protein KH452_02745 [Clostridiales bacterium]|nr:hypothetical protein [Clostridiales bacterium]